MSHSNSFVPAGELLVGSLTIYGVTDGLTENYNFLIFQSSFAVFQVQKICILKGEVLSKLHEKHTPSTEHVLHLPCSKVRCSALCGCCFNFVWFHSGACTSCSALYQSLAADKTTARVKNICSNNRQSRAGARMLSWAGGQQ